MWDTAGQEIYRSLVAMYYSGVAVALCVYDVTSRDSFEKVGDWLDEFQQKYRAKPGDQVKSAADCLFFLVGNKCDLPDT